MDILLSCENLTLKKAAKTLLHEVSCHLEAGQFTAIVGPNGAGKSTLLRALAGLEAQAVAHVKLGERKLAEISSEERAQLLAWAPEAWNIPFDFSVKEVVLLGAYPRHKGRPQPQDHLVAEALIDRVGLRDKIDMPAPALSSGERRKLMLARVLAQQTPLILLDEPDSHLDLAASLQVLGILRELCRASLTVCACLHDVLLVRRFADRVIVLKEGRVVAAGPCKQVLNASLISAVFDVESQFIATNQGELLSVHLKE